MKENFKFLGIRNPLRKELQKGCIKEISKENCIDYDLVNNIWQQEEREFQYLALDYLVKNKKKLNKEDILLLEQMIVTKSWWDSIDTILPNLVGD